MDGDNVTSLVQDDLNVCRSRRLDLCLNHTGWYAPRVGVATLIPPSLEIRRPRFQTELLSSLHCSRLEHRHDLGSARSHPLERMLGVPPAVDERSTAFWWKHPLALGQSPRASEPT